MTEPAKCHCGSASWERRIEESRYICASCKRPLWQPIDTAPVDQVVIIAAQYIPLEWEIDEEKYQSPVFDIVAAYRMYDDSPYWESKSGIWPDLGNSK